ncbi:site-specific integrase [Burkholderia aenigmatica]|uniref:site-specific integrase n=1 Tax=Burkholderia aenigmatica TaxID=2015348 RepID=UPI00264FA44B|nr:site-specific integrase [Burkholderia aenigmatica]MDN7880513.1 site-specific integrase [Burkholderia aenigmatica]
MSHKLPHLLKNRFGTYYFRLYIEGKEYRKSLYTKNFHQAKIIALAMNLELAMKPKITDFPGILQKNGNLDKLDIVLPNGMQLNNINNDDDLRRAKALLASIHQAGSNTPSQPVKPISQRLSKVVELYLAEKKLDNNAKTLRDKSSVYDEFLGWFEDKDINSYVADTAVSYKNRLIAENFSAVRINAKLSFLKDLFQYALNNNLYFGQNPFEKIKVSSKSKLSQQKESYKDFTDGELKLIFENPLYKEFMFKPDYYWLPFLALFTGARIEELASLKISQIIRDGNLVYFDIEKGKNSNSVRKIPLHKMILESKFMDYLESVKDGNLLFPHLKDGKNGYSKNASRRFGEYLDKLKITDSRKVFHSFRHTFINKMADMNVNPAMLMAIVGHYDQAKLDLSAPHFQIYQHNKTLENLKNIIDGLSYPVKLNF